MSKSIEPLSYIGCLSETVVEGHGITFQKAQPHHTEPLFAITFSKEHASRIVACVNACEGIPNEQLECDNVEFVRIFNERNTLKEQLAAANARIAELERELENERANGIHSCHPNCTKDGCVNRRLRDQIDGLEAKLALAENTLSRAKMKLHEVASIAHKGGLMNMTESDALIAIRRATLPHFNASAIVRSAASIGEEIVVNEAREAAK